ncbi:hypothetical protein Efla_006101 [Eimeria flavescens]
MGLRMQPACNASGTGASSSIHGINSSSSNSSRSTSRLEARGLCWGPSRTKWRCSSGSSNIGNSGCCCSKRPGSSSSSTSGRLKRSSKMAVPKKRPKVAANSTEAEATAAADGVSSNSSSSSSSSKEEVKEEQQVTFRSLGLSSEVCAAAAAAKWQHPTAVQQQVIPLALQQLRRLRGVQTAEHRDIIAVAATGSGKTGAFLLPLLNDLLHCGSSSSSGSSPFAVLLSPTRELALQVFDWVQALTAAAAAAEATAAAAAAAAAALRGCCCALVGGVDFSAQALSLARKPQIVVCTPGRLIDHLHRTKGFSVKGCRYVVMDEADKLLSPEYAEEISRLMASTPKEKVVLLFSATMTSSVHKLNKACLVNPVKVSIDKKTATAPVCLHGQMTQPQRIGALAKFRAGGVRVLVTTEVGSRGLDIPFMDFVLNFDVPLSSKDYIHRVGRTARAGRSGRALTLVTQYDVEAYQRIEFALEKKLEEYPDLPEEKAMALHERALEALR